MRQRRFLAAAVASGLSVSPCITESNATLWGSILDPAGGPAAGFHAVVEEVTTGAVLLSPPSGPAGQYEISVPVPGAFRPVAVVAPDGTRLSLPATSPVHVRNSSRYRLDIVFSGSTQFPPEPPPPARAWWRQPGGITALVIVHAAILAVLVGGGDEAPASPSTP